MMMQWFLFLLFMISSSSQIPIVQSKCNHQAELSALLHFKDGFEVNCIDSYGDNLGYPKTSSWKNGTIEWDGVECDAVTGHVIGLDLGTSCLHGPINSNNTSIFSHLVHLEHLNLAFNFFQRSSIPSEVSNLSRLSYLNLSTSHFQGHVPLEISKLFMLSSLDLSDNYGLELNLKSLLGNVTNLEELNLKSTDLTLSEVPMMLFTNMTSLRSLRLDGCGLTGEFPQGIFYLPKLQHLNIQWNTELEGHLPTEFNSSTTPLLESILTAGTKFRGTIPNSIGNLIALRELDLSYCSFSGGSIPSSLGNLTHLIRLGLSNYNSNFTTLSSSWLGKLTNLRYLDISRANLTGEIPPSLANLTHLTNLDLSYNQLSGEIPPGFVNLKSLDISYNMLSGPLPIQNLTSLEYLDVSNNQLSGTLKLDLFLEFTNLTFLFLSSNKLTLLVQHQRNVSKSSMLTKLEFLGLSSCQMSKFPEFLQTQQDLGYLDVSNNSIEGPIPMWMRSIKSLIHIDMSHNFITALDDPHLFLRWPYLENLDISFNKLRGSVPLPSPSIVTYQASNNELTGEIPRSLYNLTYIEGLDFSTNHLTGELNPYCFRQPLLSALNLKNNSFNGKIPEFCSNETNSFMTMIDLNSNQFQGKIPRSLANCAELEFLDVGSNFINDTFPSWLSSLSSLKVLLLKDNALHGSIGTMSNVRSGFWFPKLVIIDLSENNLSGNLLSLCFEQWMAMKTTDLRNPDYMRLYMPSYLAFSTFYYSLTMYNKGTEKEYLKILNALVVIDLSSNKFEGEIPTIIGNLLGLRSLNLSNNHLSGGIPSSLGVITHLESLDLSSNSLSGHLPQQLTGLNFLSVFNVSRNNLTGLIPQGPQFNTFSNMSYLENPGLCGEPLSRKCETSAAQPPDEMAEKEDKFWKGEILWTVVAIGFGGGLIVGVAVENMADWRMLIILYWRRMKNWRNSRISSAGELISGG